MQNNGQTAKAIKPKPQMDHKNKPLYNASLKPILIKIFMENVQKGKKAPP